jgi:hypothetical protein
MRAIAPESNIPIPWRDQSPLASALIKGVCPVGTQSAVYKETAGERSKGRIIISFNLLFERAMDMIHYYYDVHGRKEKNIHV